MPRSFCPAVLLTAVFSVYARAQQTQGITPFRLSSLNADATAQAVGACAPPPSGLVGWWPGDTGEADVAGGDNPSAVNAVTLVPGEVLDGFTFGTQGYILIPSSPNLANQRFTWAAWVRPDGSAYNDNYGSIILENNINTDAAALALYWRPKDDRFVMLFGNDLSTGDTADTITSTHTFPSGSFYLVAGTYDGSTFRLYVNGALEASAAKATTVAYSASGWTFGSSLPMYLSTSPRTWDGVIDEVQAFNRALSQSEIQAIFNAGASGVCKNPAITSGGVVSASAFGEFPSIAPGAWIEIYGSNLAQDTRGWTQADFTGLTAPTTLDGTSVTIGGKSAFIDYISPIQVNALVPSDAPTGEQQLVVTSGTGASTAYTIMVNATEPGFLAPSSFNIGGAQYVVALFTDGTYALPTGAIAGLNSRPAKPGDIITLYGVGFGPVMPDIPAGELVQQLNNLALSFDMSIGGVPATVLYSGLAPNYTGLYQFNVTVPDAAPGNAALTFTLSGGVGAQTLYLAVGN